MTSLEIQEVQMPKKNGERRHTESQGPYTQNRKRFSPKISVKNGCSYKKLLKYPYRFEKKIA